VGKNGTLDIARGIRSFIVGTGGNNHTSLASIAANSELRNTDTFGVLKLTLHPASYDWQFVPEAGKMFTDSGSAQCFGSGQPGITNTPNTPSPTSGPLPSATNTPVSTGTHVNPWQTESFTFSPIADAYVNQSSPTANYGTSTQLRTDGSPLVRSYLRFDVRNLTGGVTRATLRVYATSALSLGYDVRAVTDSVWGETTINYNNAPTFGSAIGASGPVVAGGWTNVDVTSLITGDGVYNVVLTSASGTALSLSSREAAATNRPQLVVEVQTVPTAAPTSTSTPTAAIASTSTATPSQTSTGIATNTITATATQTSTATASQTSTHTPTASATPSQTQTETPVSTDPATETGTPTTFPTDTATDTAVPFPTETMSQTPTGTSVSTPTIRTFTFSPAADAYVNQSSPTTNYGASTQFRVDGSPLVRSYLRFGVQGLNGTVTRATLRVFANSAASSGCVANIVSNNTWTETGLNYNNAPLMGGALGSSGSFGAGTWITMDVTAYITANGTYNIALTTPGSTAISLASREAGANAPQLIIETAP
jgi:hypothetical protein